MCMTETAATVDYEILALSLDCLTVYDLAEENTFLKKLTFFLTTMADCQKPLTQKITAYAKLYRTFVRTGTVASWSDRIIDLLLAAVNPFTQAAAQEQDEAGQKQLEAIAPAVLEDLNSLQNLARLKASDIKEDLRRAAIAGGREKLLAVIGKLPEWADSPSPVPATETETGNREFFPAHSILSVRRRLSTTLEVENGWPDCLPTLAAFHRHNGCGNLAFNHMFSWAGKELEPVTDPDPVSLPDLVDYTGLIGQAQANTEAFLAGELAENILFAGDRGTGKSSTVKALANHYKDSGLRLIEVRRQAITALPALMSHLRPLSLKFIIFIDDLSFETANEDYNSLKSLLQGGSSRQPDNVLIYVTTNRRHLVVERHTDASDDLFEGDARQERLSLAERFGLILTFRSPLQKNYLAIVKNLATKKGLPTDENNWTLLADRALTFATRQSSRSPRTAELFIRRQLDSGQSDRPEPAKPVPGKL